MNAINQQPKAATDEGDLIAGILQDAEPEAARLVQDAQAAADRRIEASRKQAEDILADARKTAQRQAELIQRQMADKIRMHQRRAALRVQEEILAQVLRNVEEHLADQIGKPSYGDVLVAWIVEAAIGLDVTTASVNASASERPLLDADLLKRATAKLKELTGRDVTLHVSTEVPTLLQGIALQTDESCVEFNNHLATRMVRYQSEIRRIVHMALFV